MNPNRNSSTQPDCPFAATNNNIILRKHKKKKDRCAQTIFFSTILLQHLLNAFLTVKLRYFITYFWGPKDWYVIGEVHYN